MTKDEIIKDYMGRVIKLEQVTKELLREVKWLSGRARRTPEPVKALETRVKELELRVVVLRDKDKMRDELLPVPKYIPWLRPTRIWCDALDGSSLWAASGVNEHPSGGKGFNTVIHTFPGYIGE